MVEPPYRASSERYDSMQYRRAGRSGVLLPAISLGLWHNFGSESRYADIQAMAHCAFDCGITHFDLANNYGPAYGSAEENFGKLMKRSFRPYRDEMIVSTKAGYDMWPGPYGNWGSRKYLMASIDQSLRRMGLEYVDIFYSHRYDPETPIEETMQALVDIVRSGKALYAGISNYPAEAARKAMAYLEARDTHCLLSQNKCSLLVRTPQETGLLDALDDNGTGMIAFSPLAQGLLTDRYLNGVPEGSRMSKAKFLKPETLTPSMLQCLRSLSGIAAQRGQPLSAMALAWLLSDQRITSVIIGASSPAQIKTNLSALASPPFTQEELQAINSITSKA